MAEGEVSQVHCQGPVDRLRSPSPALRARLERFQRMGLARNPFSVATPDERQRGFVEHDASTGLRVEAILAGPAVVQIVGQAGLGKSTLLASLSAALDDQSIGHVRRALPPPGPCRVARPARGISVLLIDEAQRLTRVSWGRLLRWAAGGGRRLIVTTHEPLPGSTRQDVLALHLPPVSGERVVEIFRRRIAAGGGSEEAFRLSDDAAAWLADACHYNLRLIEAILFDLFQQSDVVPAVIDRAFLRSIQSSVEARIATWPEPLQESDPG